MTDQMLFGAIFGVLSVAATYFAYSSYRLIKYHMVRKRMRTEGANVIEINVDEVKACKHTWHDITLEMLKIPVGSYKVCTTCGFVCGTDFKLNGPAMEAMAEGIKRKEEVKKEQEYLKQRLEDDIIRRRDLWINQNLHRFTDGLKFPDGFNPHRYYYDMLTNFGVYMCKEYQQAIEKVYEEEKARR